MKAEDFDKKFDCGESVLSDLDLSSATRPDQIDGSVMNNPIVDEVHRIRDRLWAECDGDFQKYLDRIRDAHKPAKKEG